MLKDRFERNVALVWFVLLAVWSVWALWMFVRFWLDGPGAGLLAPFTVILPSACPVVGLLLLTICALGIRRWWLTTSGQHRDP